MALGGVPQAAIRHAGVGSAKVGQGMAEAGERVPPYGLVAIGVGAPAVAAALVVLTLF